MLHDFAERLEFSQGARVEAFWMAAYRKIFPGLLSGASVDGDGWAQRAGIDRVLTLKCGRVMTVDEKARQRADSGDILLERWSDRARKVPGWVQKPLACDLIAYGFIPSRRCYVFPVWALRRAWRDRGKDWLTMAESEEQGFRICLAHNRRYVTENVAVPTDRLLAAVQDAMVVTLEPGSAE
jgi:hypothetical protein